jgi:hypothetical protein
MYPNTYLYTTEMTPLQVPELVREIAVFVEKSRDLSVCAGGPVYPCCSDTVSVPSH